MLLELRVENYAVIDHVAVEFAAGLNLLTGETGAGKSILIDALALLLGEKASAEVIRHGAEKAVVSAVFQVEGPQAAAVLEANGLDTEAGEIILRREVAAGGKGRVFINNQPATVTVLRQLAPELASIHAQNETLMAFDASARLALLDTYAGTAVAPVAAAFEKWKTVRQHIQELERDEQDRLRLVDLWSFQRKEIEEAHPEAGEDERLEAEKRILADAEKVRAAALYAYHALYEGENAASASLRAAERRVQELAGYDEATFREDLAALESARIQAEDCAGKLRDYAERINASPERLTEIEDRLALLDRLKRKYGQTLAEVIAYGAEAARKLNEVENRDEVLRQLRADLATAATEYLRAARALSRQRADAARKLEKLVEDEINDLAMKAKFKIELGGGDEEGNWTAAGFDQVRYMISTNPGDPLRPVEQIASGGELSRVMLSLKACVESGGEAGARARRNAKSAPRTLVFDEIDAGIGGRAAEAVGRKLKSLARSQQVLCITHLPQIASFADQHYRIDKRVAGGKTRTSIARLSEAERTQEVARMLSGAKLTETSLKHAEQLLKTNA